MRGSRGERPGLFPSGRTRQTVGMSFFTPLEPDPEPPQEQRKAPPSPIWLRPPTDEIPVAIPSVCLLARVPGAVLHQTRIDVHREGIVIRLRLDIRLEDRLSPERRTEVDALLDPRRHRPGAERGLRLGVSTAEGDAELIGTASRGFLHRMSGDAPTPPQLTAVDGGGSGDGDHWTASLGVWLWPLPAEGDVTLHYVSDAVGIPEGSITIDGEPLREAALGVVRVWGDSAP